MLNIYVYEVKVSTYILLSLFLSGIGMHSPKTIMVATSKFKRRCDVVDPLRHVEKINCNAMLAKFVTLQGLLLSIQ